MLEALKGRITLEDLCSLSHARIVVCLRHVVLELAQIAAGGIEAVDRRIRELVPLFGHALREVRPRVHAIDFAHDIAGEIPVFHDPEDPLLKALELDKEVRGDLGLSRLHIAIDLLQDLHTRRVAVVAALASSGHALLNAGLREHS